MKIDNNAIGLNLDRAGAAAPATRYGQTSGSGNASGNATDQVSLSGLGQQLRDLAVDSPERQEKVKALAAAYANGSYQVDAKAVSSAIVGDALKPFF